MYVKDQFCKNELKVNIIIPVYNREKYIERCITSLLTQSFRFWEAICVDDGSTDNSGHILDGFSAQDNRIKVIHQANAGVSNARNTALRECVAPYIVMVDSDDYLETDALKLMVSALERNMCDLVISGIGYLSVKAKPILNVPPFLQEGLHMVNLSQFIHVNPGPVAKLYKREIIEKYNLLFPEDITMGEDCIFVACYWSLIKSCYFIESSLYLVDKSENSLTKRFSDGNLTYSVYVDTLNIARIIYDKTIHLAPSRLETKWIASLLELFLRERDFVFDYVACPSDKLKRLKLQSRKCYQFFSVKLGCVTRIKVVTRHEIIWLKGRLFRCLGKIKRFLIKMCRFNIVI